MPLNKNILFIHIPKCGGHSVESAMGIKHSKFLSNEYSFKHLFGMELQHLTLKEVEILLPKSAYSKSFSIVRDPKDRLISEYFWSGPWSGISAFENERVKLGLSRKDRILDRHLLPQNQFTFGHFKLDEIFKFGDFNAVADFLGVEKIPHLNSRKALVNDPELHNQMKI